jgi:carboxyl-terminal processing protease
VKQHEARVRKDKAFQYLVEDIAESRLLRTKNLVSLNEAARRKELATQEARLAARETRKDSGKDGGKEATSTGVAIRDDGLQPGERSIAAQLSAEKEREKAKDVLLMEAVNIMGDAARVLGSPSGLTAKVN